VKATVGRVTTKGVVPACRSLDVVSCFAATVPDAALVVQIMESAGTLADPQWRAPPPGLSRSLVRPPQFRYALPNAEFLDFSGPGGPGAVEGAGLPICNNAFKCAVVLANMQLCFRICSDAFKRDFLQILRRAGVWWSHSFSFAWKRSGFQTNFQICSLLVGAGYV
jgi:hypothetical protein